MKIKTKIEDSEQHCDSQEAESLETIAHLQKWAIAHVEDDFISTHELVETVNRVRRVETIYTKDFSELTGAKAVILTA